MALLAGQLFDTESTEGYFIINSLFVQSLIIGVFLYVYETFYNLSI